MMKTRKLMTAVLAALAFSLIPASSAGALPSASVGSARAEAMPAALNTPDGNLPASVRRYYGFDKLPFDGSGQTIAIVSAYNYPTAAADMAQFIQTFGLKNMYGLPGTESCTVAEGPYPCFEKVAAPSANQDGPLTMTENTFFHQESALDTQWAHAMAPGANILLVEAATGHMPDLLAAVDKAVEMGASVVSMSWGLPESKVDLEEGNRHFEVPGVVFVAASGDQGSELQFPASSPNVLSVGGTTARIARNGRMLAPEVAWSLGSSGSVGGYSAHFEQPAYQSDFQSSGKRAVPDVSYAAAKSGFVTFYKDRWYSYGGTSSGAPQWAGLIALANQARSENGTETLSGVEPFYAAAAGDLRTENFMDITEGTGACLTSQCAATSGYDIATGLGSPRADRLVWTLAGLPVPEEGTYGSVSALCNNWDCAPHLTYEAMGEATGSKLAYYQFEAVAGTEYQITFASDRTAQAMIYDADKNLVTTLKISDYSSISENWTAPGDGTFYIVVKGTTAIPAVFTLRLEQ
jgi:hypothetical protein